MAEERFGKYEIKSILGRGAMGTVYEGWDPIISRRVAIKTVRLPDSSDNEGQEELARFRREAQATGRLTHPNIVGVFDYGETSELAYIVMEFIDGQPLKSLLEKEERFPLAESARLMAQLLAGLQYSHENGVVHRDIKPANLMITRDGRLKIADFGIARIESSNMTQAGTVMGTPAYMSPEQIMGQTVDARTDIYSAGVVLYQLLTGERPFEGSMSAIMHKALNVQPPRPSDLSVTAPPALDAVVAKAMAKRPGQRFDTAADFAQAVQAALAQAPAQEDASDATMVVAPTAAAVAPVTPAPALAPVVPAVPAMAGAPRSRTTPAIAGGALAALVLIGGGAWFFLHSGGERPPAAAPIVATPAPSGAPQEAAPAPAPAPVSPSSEPSAAPSPVVPATPSPPAATAVPSAPPPVAVAPTSPPSAPAAEASPPAPAPAPPTSARLRAAFATVPCTLINGQIAPGERLLLDGLAGVGTPDSALRQIVAELAPGYAAAWRVNTFKGPYCGALDVLRPIGEHFATGDDALSLMLKGSRTALRKNELIVPQLTMPGFAAHLIVDYLSSDGTVTHLLADDGDEVRILTQSGPKIMGPSRAWKAGSLVTLGEPDRKMAFEGWAVDEPYGTDMIMAIASSAPLFDAPRLAGTTESYLRDLRAAIEAARGRGVRVAGQALLLETSAR